MWVSQSVMARMDLRGECTTFSGFQPNRAHPARLEGARGIWSREIKAE